nr:hypothetical protein Iba_chr05eCG14170 [Ipomoea batatas]GMD84568.1 hypothetical protein Iba_chr14aCG15990 [Ipomoea batatas]GME18777.1 hypothetical protein Iba_scaffold21254CG0020 [Ipomoea batatas]
MGTLLGIPPQKIRCSAKEICALSFPMIFRMIWWNFSWLLLPLHLLHHHSLRSPMASPHAIDSLLHATEDQRWRRWNAPKSLALSDMFKMAETSSQGS